MIKPIKTEVMDISSLSSNYTSSIYLKREDLQITNSHKYRLATSLMVNLWGDDMKNDVVIATSGNTGHAVAAIAHLLGIKCRVYANQSLTEKSEKNILMYNAVLLKYIDADDAVEHAKEFVDANENWIYLNQYDDFSGANGFKVMADELKEDIPGINSFVTPIGTGATLFGVSKVLPNINLYAATIDDEWLTIPGVRNFRVSKPGDIITYTYSNANVTHIYKFTIDEIVERQIEYQKKLQLPINLSTTLGIMSAVDVANKYNDTVIATICTGIE